MAKPQLMIDVGEVSNLLTSSKEVVGAINEEKTQLDTTIEALNDMGYLSPNIILTTVASINKSGKYTIGTECTDKPEQGVHFYTCDAIFEREGFGTLLLKEYASGSKVWTSNIEEGVLRPWQQIATTEQINERLKIVTDPIETDANNMINTGVYRLFANIANIPILKGTPTVASTEGFLYVTKWTNNYIEQEFVSLYGSRATRVCLNGVWRPWEPIATTTKTSFSLTASPGFTIKSQNCYVQNGKIYIRADIVGTFTANTRVQIASAPSDIGLSGVNSISCTTNNSGEALFQGFASCGLSGWNIYAITSIASSGVQINGVIG